MVAYSDSSGSGAGRPCSHVQRRPAGGLQCSKMRESESPLSGGIVDVDVELEPVVARAGAELEVVAQVDRLAHVRSHRRDALELMQAERAAFAVEVLEAAAVVVLILEVEADAEHLLPAENRLVVRRARAGPRAVALEGDDAVAVLRQDRLVAVEVAVGEVGVGGQVEPFAAMVGDRPDRAPAAPSRRRRAAR